MSWDGKEMYMLSLNVQNGGGSVSKIGMDGSGAQNNLSGLSTSHHDFTAIPGGIATMLWNKTGIDAPCSVVERAADGTMTTIVADVASLYTSSNGYHSNAIHYYPSDDTYTISDRNPNLFVKITRKGQLLWQFGGTSPKDPTKFFSGSASWQVNHGHQLLADGTFLFFNNGAGGSSTMRVFKLDTTAMTATSSYMYTPASQHGAGRRPAPPQRQLPHHLVHFGADHRNHLRRRGGHDHQGDLVRLLRVPRVPLRPPAVLILKRTLGGFFISPATSAAGRSPAALTRLTGGLPESRPRYR